VNVSGQPFRTVWCAEDDPETVWIIDQERLPYAFHVVGLRTLEEAASAIREMKVRGAGLIGATAGYGMYLAALHAPRGSREGFLTHLEAAAETLRATRPTAVNLAWAVARVLAAVRAGGTTRERLESARRTAQAIADEDAEACRRIGEHGLALLKAVARRKPGEAVNVLTHCNAGWLAFVDYGSATAPLYAAFDAGIPVHVWVDETRPRNQGAKLTAWELREHGVPHTVVTDNAGGHLMQRGLVDLVLVGSDRTTRTGDVANKIGTYLKALAAADNGVPFYVALPSSTFDWTLRDGIRGVPIEERSPEEVTHLSGQLENGEVARVRLTPEGSAAANYGFDVTPARLVTGLITERGICRADEADILRLFPEQGPHELRPA
jgi:methylthioribose-1-phosphate isomerase